ncbi:uncharacterized protein TNIN_435611 [Trichonephila inaurata madagascariensis]|uniref:Uncharacterized protein n=1 Tax=Trichonephila inaurata madagascariensis TaxID=2747483 RepID=A0A8X6XYX3_9ARAC|nr:uncharacterized protein TNIN_435611 [Trichonephila inaurata madagascariensis]
MFKSSTSFYRHLGRWSSTLVGCPECREPMTVRHFYSTHAPQKYNLDCRKQCLFCFGRKHWPYGQKNRPENVNHVTACLQRFVEDATINEEEDENETVEPEEEVCGCRHFQPVPRDMQGRRKDRLSEYVGVLRFPVGKTRNVGGRDRISRGLGKRRVGHRPALSEGGLDVVSRDGKT